MHPAAAGKNRRLIGLFSDCFMLSGFAQSVTQPFCLFQTFTFLKDSI
jgi:hypothetical protein